jgi:hypothetical protein
MCALYRCAYVLAMAACSSPAGAGPLVASLLTHLTMYGYSVHTVGAHTLFSPGCCGSPAVAGPIVARLLTHPLSYCELVAPIACRLLWVIAATGQAVRVRLLAQNGQVGLGLGFR